MELLIINKMCKKCNTERPSICFYRDKTQKDGLCIYCKECQKVYSKRYHIKHCDVQNIRTHQWGIDNPDKLKSLRLKYSLGITFQDKLDLFGNQDGCCARCSKKFESVSKAHVDHNHETNKIRALLCVRCNVMLRTIEDKKELKLSLEYLNKYDKERIMEV